jgi:hypothetical protein
VEVVAVAAAAAAAVEAAVMVVMAAMAVMVVMVVMVVSNIQIKIPSSTGISPNPLSPYLSNSLHSHIH